MHAWLLPEGIEDLLPCEAAQIETLRRRLLDEFVRHGYQLVMPPLLEFAEGLLDGAASDLNLSSFKLVDQLSGRTLALRPDITPQVARIDAHLLNRTGVTRLCYCGSVLHTRPAGLFSSREPLQIGIELYGHAGLEADHEVIRLLARTLELAQLPPTRIDLGHVGIFRALVAGQGLTPEHEQALFEALQAKDLPSLGELTAALPETVRDALRVLPALYGGEEVIRGASVCLPMLPEITRCLGDLQRLAKPQPLPGAILAPWPEDAALQAEIARLRAAGEIVIAALPGHEGSWREAGCDRRLVRRNDAWIIEPLGESSEWPKT